MPTRRRLLASASALAAGGLAGCSGDPDTGTEGTPTGTRASTEDSPTPSDGSLTLTSPAFEDGGTIPERFTCSGENVSPTLEVEGVPAAASLALIVDDPDAPREEPWVHWLLWNVPPETDEIPEAVDRGETVAALDGARQGTNTSDAMGYSGPCPPPDDGPHTYRYQLHALDAELDVEAGERRDALESAMDGSVLERTTLAGEYDR